MNKLKTRYLDLKPYKHIFVLFIRQKAVNLSIYSSSDSSEEQEKSLKLS